jgi:hypothetical protein
MKKLILLTALIISGLSTWAQEPNTKAVIAALEKGNATELAGLCIPNLDLTVLGKDDVYSRAQAEQILKKYFEQNKPTAFTTEHEGVSKVGDLYVIGKLATSTGEYRVTFFLKKAGETYQVKQLRIEQGKG